MYVKTRTDSQRITGGSTDLPHPSVPGERPSPEPPPFVIMYPPPGAYKLIDTHILERAIREFAIPFVLDFFDLVRLVMEDIDLAINNLLFADALYDIASTQVHTDWVAAGSDFVMEALDFREGSLEAIPLRFVSVTTFGNGDRVFEDGVIIP